jgi:hypothetical protein
MTRISHNINLTKLRSEGKIGIRSGMYTVYLRSWCRGAVDDHDCHCQLHKANNNIRRLIVYYDNLSEKRRGMRL